MRREARIEHNVTLSRVDGYHHGPQTAGVSNYAYSGFEQAFWYVSDRYHKVVERHGRLVRVDTGEEAHGYGLEIETESTIPSVTCLAEVFTKIIFPYFPDGLFKMQSDCSLSGASTAECITQVMTKSAIRNNYRNFKSMFNTYFQNFGISAASRRCGMHVNISLLEFGKSAEKQEEAVRKLFYLVCRHFGMMCALVCRAETATGYCSQPYSGTPEEIRSYVKTCNLHEFYSDHGTAFNLGHYNEGRVELRLVAGQKDYGAFRNTMESVFFLVDAVKRLKWEDLEDKAKIFKGCNQYVFDRLRTKVKDAGHITTEDLVKIRETVKRENLL